MKITEISVQKNNPQRVNVYVDGEYAFSLDDVDMVTMGVKVGNEITDAQIESFLFESQYGKAKAKALDILSRRSVSGFMLKEELLKKGYDELVAERVKEELEELGYIDDKSYTLLFFEYAESKVWGKKKIFYELSKKGIDNNILKDAIEEFKLPDAEDIANVIKQRYKNEDLSDYKVRQKIMRFFASRGFEFSQIEDGIRLSKE